MSSGWRAWFWTLAVGAAVSGVGLLLSANERAAGNELFASSAPQQTVAALWMVQDLLTIVALELMVLVVAAVSFFIWRGSVVPVVLEPHRVDLAEGQPGWREAVEEDFQPHADTGRHRSAPETAPVDDDDPPEDDSTT